jgi:sugar fermentation stimulation protein A
MRFDSPLVDAVLLKRYKRFLADVKLPSGEVIVAHVPNSGSMKGVSSSGSPCRILKSSNPLRKLPYTLEMVQVESKAWVGVNTSRTNSLVRELIEKKIIESWSSYSEIKPEIKINAESRLDFLLSHETKKHYIEVKNVSMATPPLAVFPDAETTRGQKHLNELALLAKQGHGAEIFFVVQREDCHAFRPCDDIDPEYGRILRRVTKEGVNIQCWSCTVNADGIEIVRPLEIDLT